MGQQARYLDLLEEYEMKIVHRPGSSHQNSVALSHRPCERAREVVARLLSRDIACRQCRRTEMDKGGRTVRVMTRGQQWATAKLEEKKKVISKREMDLSPGAIRDAPRAEGYLQTIMDLLDTGDENPPWSAVEGADLNVQQLYSQWEALQLLDGVLYRNFLGTDRQVRWRQLLIPRWIRAPLLQHLHVGTTAIHMGVKNTGQGDEDGLLEGLEGRRGTVL